jgi:hypothetical protein
MHGACSIEVHNTLRLRHPPLLTSYPAEDFIACTKILLLQLLSVCAVLEPRWQPAATATHRASMHILVCARQRSTVC